jgi:hypothetical protein
MTMPNIFWKKIKKPLGELSPDERKEFAKELVAESLENLIRPKVAPEMFATEESLRKLEMDELFDLYSKWSEIYTTERKRLIEDTYYASLEILRRSRKLSRDEYLKWEKEYLYYEWLDEVIGKPLLDVYKVILSKRNLSMLHQSWPDRFETEYRSISYGEKSKKGPILLTLKLLIKEKGPRYPYEVGLDPELKLLATEKAFSLFSNQLSNGLVPVASDYRSIFSL